VTELVCMTDGVSVVVSRAGPLVHVDELPPHTDEHVIAPVNKDWWWEHVGARSALKAAAEDMLAHHATLHPSAGCEWAEKLGRAVKTA